MLRHKKSAQAKLQANKTEQDVPDQRQKAQKQTKKRDQEA
jgi:hypothetical protein